MWLWIPRDVSPALSQLSPNLKTPYFDCQWAQQEKPETDPHKSYNKKSGLPLMDLNRLELAQYLFETRVKQDTYFRPRLIGL